MEFLILVMILLPMAMGPILYRLGKRNGKLSARLTVVVLAAELLCAVALTGRVGDALVLPGVCGLGLTFSVSGMQATLCLLASLLWMVSGFASREYLHGNPNIPRYDMFLLLTQGAIMGVFLSADLFTTLVFFETMSFASYPLVIHQEDPAALRAGASYMAYAVIGGMVSLMGLFLLWTQLGTLSYEALTGASLLAEGSKVGIYVAGGLTFVTFAAKVCMYPLHTWLPMAHPAAPAPASALLSGIITKAGIFGIFGITARLFFHDAAVGKVLLVFSVITMVWGGFMGLCNTNLKAILAYSTMSQIGFILTGVSMQLLLGEENRLAIWGSVLHLVNHAWFKLVLFVTAGIIHHSLGKLELSDLQGYGRGKYHLMFIFLMPALGVSGIPLWNGYISKTLLHESIVEYTAELIAEGHNAVPYQAAEWLFLLAGGMTLAYMTKIFICIFIERNHDAEVQAKYDSAHVHVTRPLMWVMTACALACPVLGMTPHITLERIAEYCQPFFMGGEHPHEEAHVIHYFSLTNLKGSVISIAIGVALYVLFVRVFVRKTDGYRNPWPKVLDLEESLYLPLIFKVLPFIGALCARFAGSLFEWFSKLCNRILFFRYDRIVHPAEDMYFGRYQEDDPGVRGYRGQLAYGLAFFGVGFVAIIAFLLVVNFVA